jgi:putative hemolysin
MKKTIIISLFVIISIMIIGCNTEIEDNTNQNTEPKTGIEDNTNQNTETNTQIANPASTFCIENGGSLEIQSSQEGEYANCNFPDGSYCEEWAFFRGECQIGESLINENENSDDPNNNNIDVTELEIACNNEGGQWIGSHYECEYISEDFCNNYNGDFNPCGSACRHESDDVICTQQCVAFCKFNI